MFHVGQKVICVDTEPPSKSALMSQWLPWLKPLIKGAIYTVTEVGLSHPLDREKLPCITVAEMPHVVWAHRFRPLIKKTTDISVFTAMLTKKRVRA